MCIYIYIYIYSVYIYIYIYIISCTHVPPRSWSQLCFWLLYSCVRACKPQVDHIQHVTRPIYMSYCQKASQCNLIPISYCCSNQCVKIQYVYGLLHIYIYTYYDIYVYVCVLIYIYIHIYIYTYIKVSGNVVHQLLPLQGPLAWLYTYIHIYIYICIHVLFCYCCFCY